MQLIPLQAQYAQTFTISLGGQNCVITLRQRSTGMFMDLTLNGVTLMTEVLCRSWILLVRQAYLGFTGDLCFTDAQGTADPSWDGLGARWNLLYLAPTDLPVPFV